MTTPGDDDALLHEIEQNVRAELELAEAGQPEPYTAKAPLDELRFDPADVERYEVGLHDLLDAVETLEGHSGPGDPRRPHGGAGPAE